MVVLNLRGVKGTYSGLSTNFCFAVWNLLYLFNESYNYILVMVISEFIAVIIYTIKCNTLSLCSDADGYTSLWY